MIDRRTFAKVTAAAALGSLVDPFGASAQSRIADGAEVLYNGIRLTAPWPPVRSDLPRDKILTPPYILDPPDVIPIDVGRQLFVDNFLIEDTTLDRSYHAAEYIAGNPVFRPETPWERADLDADRLKITPRPTAMPFSDGVFFDPADRLFKMWYMSGYGKSMSLAVSEDGRAWHRPPYDVVPGTNIVYPDDRDSATVWLDLREKNPRLRYKMMLWTYRVRRLLRFTSPDGIHWEPAGMGGPSGDRTTFFYNAFRDVWVFSIREWSESLRSRRYWESHDFAGGFQRWNEQTAVPWAAADDLDRPRNDTKIPTQLYNLDCVAYESVLLGLFTIFRGDWPYRQKPNSVSVGFSRDGFHWERPSREPFIGVSERAGDWNWANVQSAGGCCLVVGDLLYFYVSGRAGVPGTGEPGTCSTGLAVLRRDGFVSLDDPQDSLRATSIAVAPRQVTTRPVRFTGSALFVNADVEHGELRAEILDRDGKVIAPWTAALCVPLARNATRMQVTWTSGASLADVAGQPVRFRFYVTRGRLFSFWVSRSARGASNGYVAAGGPGFESVADSD